MKTIARWIATWFFCGYAPIAPGTAGSLAAIAIAWLIHHYTGLIGPAFGGLAAVLFLPAVWAAGVTAEQSGLIDPQIVVVDEVVGQWLTLAGATDLNWKSWMAALLLFRIFDVWKPPPVRQLERLHGGLGIVADDAMAGIYGAAVLFAAGWFHLY